MDNFRHQMLNKPTAIFCPPFTVMHSLRIHYLVFEAIMSKTHCFTCNHTGSERYGTIVSIYFAEDIRIIIAEGCDFVYIIWNPVSKGELYRLQFLEKDNILHNATTEKIIFNISLSDSRFKEKTFSVRVSVI